MIHITVNVLKFGNLGVRSAPYDAFEVIQFKPNGEAAAVARIEVQKSDHPELRLCAQETREVSNHLGSVAAVESACLGSWSDEISTSFTLSVSGANDGLEFVLAGRRNHHNFWWRLQFNIVGGRVIVKGPALASDPHS